MTTKRLILLTDIEESKCGACGSLVRNMGPYCLETRQRLDLADCEDFDSILRHCGGPYPLRNGSNPAEDESADKYLAAN